MTCALRVCVQAAELALAEARARAGWFDRLLFSLGLKPAAVRSSLASLSAQAKMLKAKLPPLPRGPSGAAAASSGSAAASSSSSGAAASPRSPRADREDTPLMDDRAGVEEGTVLNPGGSAPAAPASAAGAPSGLVHKDRMAVIDTDPSRAERAPFVNPMHQLV